MTLKQNQGHQSHNENVDPKLGYKHAKSERSRYNGIQEKGNIKVVFKQENMSIISLEQVQQNKTKKEKKEEVYSWSAGCNQQTYKVST